MNSEDLMWTFGAVMLGLTAYTGFAAARWLDGRYDTAWRIVPHAVIGLLVIGVFVLAQPNGRARLAVAGLVAMVALVMLAVSARRHHRRRQDEQRTDEALRAIWRDGYAAGREVTPEPPYALANGGAAPRGLEGEILPPLKSLPSTQQPAVEPRFEAAWARAARQLPPAPSAVDAASLDGATS